MTEWHLKSRKKPSGGFRNSKNRSDKKLVWKGGDFIATKVSEKDDRTNVQKRGLTSKTKLKQAKSVSLNNTSTGKTEKAQVLRVVSNPADRHYARRDIITKGGVVEVQSAKNKVFARITSRPGQTGSLSATVLSAEESKKFEELEKK